MDPHAPSLGQLEEKVPVRAPAGSSPAGIIDVPAENTKNSATDPASCRNNNSDSSSSPESGSASHSKAKGPSGSERKMRPREFVWGKSVIWDIMPRYTIPAWLDPLYVDVDDPRKLPLCWYVVPFYSGIVFACARRIRIAVYMEHENLALKPGDLDAFGTWPRLVEWIKEQSGLEMHLHQVWDERKPLLTFFNNHEMMRVTRDMWMFIGDLLDDMVYPEECKTMCFERPGADSPS